MVLVIVVVLIVVVVRSANNTHLLLHGGHKDPTPAWLEEACHERLQHAWTSSRRVKKIVKYKNHQQQSLSELSEPQEG